MGPKPLAMRRGFWNLLNPGHRRLARLLWQRVPNRKIPFAPMLAFAPDLVAEVLSPSNTREKMQQKLRDYFAAGVLLVWYVDPVKRTIQVFSAVDQSTLLREGEPLTGEPVLPGFVLSLQDLFAPLEQ